MFGDAERIVIEALGDLLATVSTEPPTGPLSSTPHVQVELDGTPEVVEAWGGKTVAELATVRLVAHCKPGDRTAVKALASQALSAALLIPGASTLVGRSSVTPDPTTKNLMVWALLRLAVPAQRAS